MENAGVLNFEVGQLAELRTFEPGFRGAWFRCKIQDILIDENKILLEYYDFEEEEITWEKIYLMPPYGRKSRHIPKQLMVRPCYPLMCLKSEMPPLDEIQEVCVVIDGTWKVGDWVDWYTDSCYWSARVIKLLSDDKVQVELPFPPVGEGLVDGPILEAFCKDLRPTLDWLPTEGWRFPHKPGQPSSSAQLIFPSKQGMDSEKVKIENAAAASPHNASSTSHISVNSLAAQGLTSEQQVKSAPVESVESRQQVKNEDDDDEMVESVIGKASSSDSISTMNVVESKQQDADATMEDVDYTTKDLNIKHEDTLEACVIDLEELVSKVKWMKSILDGNKDTTSWEFS